MSVDIDNQLTSRLLPLNKYKAIALKQWVPGLLGNSMNNFIYILLITFFQVKTG